MNIKELTELLTDTSFDSDSLSALHPDSKAAVIKKEIVNAFIFI